MELPIITKNWVNIEDQLEVVGNALDIDYEIELVVETELDAKKPSAVNMDVEAEGDEEPDAKIKEQIDDEKNFSSVEIENMVIQLKKNCAENWGEELVGITLK